MHQLVSTIGRHIYVVYVVVVFLVTFFIHFPIFLIVSVFGKRVDGLLFKILKVNAIVFFFLSGIVVRVRGKKCIDKNQQYVVIANHGSYLDVPMIYASLPIFMKILARSDFGKIPLFGIVYKRMAILVDRSRNMSKYQSVQEMKSVMQNDGASIFIFPEGSFNETDSYIKELYNGAFKIAKSGGLPILPVIFPDTVKRWSYTGFWDWSPGISRTVILQPISSDIVMSSSVDELKSIARERMEYAFANIEK